MDSECGRSQERGNRKTESNLVTAITSFALPHSLRVFRFFIVIPLNITYKSNLN